MLDEFVIDRIVTEVKILHVDAAMRLVDGLEQICEFLLTIHEKCHRIVVRKAHALAAQLVYD
jgi:hypothetical protein